MVLFAGTVWVILSAPSLHDNRVPITRLNITTIKPTLQSINKTIPLTDHCNEDLIVSIAQQMESSRPYP